MSENPNHSPYETPRTRSPTQIQYAYYWLRVMLYVIINCTICTITSHICQYKNFVRSIFHWSINYKREMIYYWNNENKHELIHLMACFLFFVFIFIFCHICQSWFCPSSESFPLATRENQLWQHNKPWKVKTILIKVIP